MFLKKLDRKKEVTHLPLFRRDLIIFSCALQG